MEWLGFLSDIIGNFKCPVCFLCLAEILSNKRKS